MTTHIHRFCLDGEWWGFPTENSVGFRGYTLNYVVSDHPYWQDKVTRGAWYPDRRGPEYNNGEYTR
jgi:hypothetical protein